MNRRCLTTVATGIALLACNHAEPFETVAPVVGPSSAGPDVRLTFNSNQDYWPAWTEDGLGILYSFIPVGSVPQHRCVGLLPAGGGGATWQMCDDRATEIDSVSSFTAYALGNDGRLLYVEATARQGAGSTAPARTTLFLADSAKPFIRQTLLQLPVTVGGSSISWLSDITWTGPTTFLALGMAFQGAGHCRGCIAIDSLYYGLTVVSGAITGGSATLSAVAGTSGATGYSLAEGGSSIVFTLRDDRRLYKVPVGGGTPTGVTTVTTAANAQLLGISCKLTTCVVAVDPVTLTSADGLTFPNSGSGPNELRGISLSSGQVQVLRSTNAGIVATPMISPVTGDVVAQVGGSFGHLQTITSAASDLHLYLGLVQ